MFGLSFLYPLFLIGAAAAAVPIVLHLIRRQSALEVPFSAVRFLKRAPVEQTRRKHLRELILLALRVTALLVLALAFARPYLLDGAASAAAPVTMVAVDTSLSMAGGSRFDTARSLAVRAVRSAPSGALVGLMRFDDGAEVIVEPTTERALVESSIGRLAPGYGATRYRSALARASAVIGGRMGRIVVVTDLQRSGWETGDQGTVAEGLAVEVADVGAVAGNLAVVSLRAEPARVLAVVSNSGTSAVTTMATLELDGGQLASLPVSVQGRSTSEVRFEVALPPAGAVRVSVADRLGYPGDDVRFLALDPPRPIGVLVVGTTGRPGAESFYFERALAASDESLQFRVRSVTGTALVPGVTIDGARLDVIALLATRGIGRAAADALAAHLESGGGLLVALGAEFDGAVLGMLDARHLPLRITEASREAAVTFAPADVRHPIFKPLGAALGGLSRVRFTRAARVSDETGRTLARFSDGTPAVIEYRAGQGRILVFTSDLNNRWNDFPLHITYVPFIHETVRYLAGSREDVRDILVSDAPSGVARQPGVAVLGSEKRRIAVNVDAGESDASRITVPQFAAAISRLNEGAAVERQQNATKTEEEQSYWRYGLLLMLAALAAEGVLGAKVA